MSEPDCKSVTGKFFTSWDEAKAFLDTCRTTTRSIILCLKFFGNKPLWSIDDSSQSTKQGNPHILDEGLCLSPELAARYGQEAPLFDCASSHQSWHRREFNHLAAEYGGILSSIPGDLNISAEKNGLAQDVPKDLLDNLEEILEQDGLQRESFLSGSTSTTRKENAKTETMEEKEQEKEKKQKREKPKRQKGQGKEKVKGKGKGKGRKRKGTNKSSAKPRKPR